MVMDQSMQLFTKVIYIIIEYSNEIIILDKDKKLFK